MSAIGKQVLIAAFGLLTFALTVAAVALVERFTGFNLFTLSIWVVVPAGALITGALAASGYYFGSVLLHTRPSWVLLLQLVVVAALAQVAIYYAEYSTLTFEDGTLASSVATFSQYLDVYLTKMHLRVGKGMHDTGEVGSFGYWLAAFQFIGFIAGGVAIYFFLKASPTCPSCRTYLRTLVKHKQNFNDQNEFVAFYDNLFKHPVDTPEFAQWLNWHPQQGKPQPGTVTVTTKLSGCPSCADQLIAQEVQVLAKNEWKDVNELTRRVWMPKSFDLRSVIKLKSAAKSA